MPRGQIAYAVLHVVPDPMCKTGLSLFMGEYRGDEKAKKISR
jgi:hypothetical protein